MRTSISRVLLLISLTAPSCVGPATPLVPALSVGGISNDTVEAEATFCGGVAVTIESNVDWTASSDSPSWVEVSPSKGKAGEFYEAQVYFKNRNYSDSRTAVVSIVAGDKSYSFCATQRAYDPVGLGFDNPETVTDGHPCLLASGKEFTQMRKAATREGSILKVMHDYIMRYADAAISCTPVKYELSGGRLLTVCAEALKRVFYGSYAYRITGDPRYAAYVERELLAISAFKDWNPSNFIEPSEMMMACAIGYDWCYPRLSASTKAAMLSALKDKGLDRYFEWGGARNNFNQVCNAGALYGSYIYRDIDTTLYCSVRDRAVDMVKIALEGYVPGGTYVEGPGYWCYGTSYNTLMFDLFQRVYGDTRGLLEEFPDFLRTADYYNAVITPSYQVFDYSDQGFPAQVSIVPFYVYDRTGRGDVLSVQKSMLVRSMLNYDHCRHERLLPAAIVYAARRGVESVGGADVPRSFVGGGETPFASLRGSSYVAIKLGHPDTGHGHMDIGAFCFESDGIQWSTDMGGESYSAIEAAGVDLWNYSQGSQRWSLMRCGPQGHSVLTFDGGEQVFNARADFLSCDTSDADDMRVCANLTPLYAGVADSLTRTIRLTGGTVGEVTDSVVVGAKTTLLRWNMVSQASAVRMDARGALLTAPGGRAVRMDVEGLDSFQMKQWSSTPSRSCESANSELIVGFEAELEAGKTYVIKVRLTPSI